MSSLSDRLPVPPSDSINTGLSAVTERTMKRLLGIPGDLTRDCSDPTEPFSHKVVFGRNVGPFVVSGLEFALDSLEDIFRQVKIDHPDVFAEVKTEGMLCVRARRTNPDRFSNHSWGAAIDLFFGTRVVDQGVRKVHRGNLLLYSYFHRHGWYWGAEFPGDSVDSMHFELAEETILDHFGD